MEERDIVQRLREAFSERIVDVREHAGQLAVWVQREEILAVLRFLKEDPELSFEALTDVTAVDHLRLEDLERNESLGGENGVIGHGAMSFG